MKRRPLLVIGAGGHARACIDVIEQHSEYRIAGLVGTSSEIGKEVFGYSLLGCDEGLPDLVRKHGFALIAIGHIKTSAPRENMLSLLDRLGCALPVIISPRAYVSPHAAIGQGTIVMHYAVVNAEAAVGRNCILNSRSLIEHDAVIGDHCHISTAATINGGAHVGAATFVGSGATVRESIRIGERCLIGMGQKVLKDYPSGTRFPAAEEAS